ncbi:MAG: ChaN family lipoprotein [Bacteroidales bacterium]
MKKLIVLVILTFSFLSIFSQNYDAYVIYNSKARQVGFDKVLKKVSDADIVFFGESHNDPIAHWLQLKLIEDLPGMAEGQVIAGAEMFETDNQLILDEYLSDFIDDKRFEAGARLWNNYKTDYKPLIIAAKENDIPFIATNIPRRYANMVSKQGFESLNELTDEAKELMAPLPIPYDPEVPAYKKMMEMSMGHGMANENFPKAQAIKDATMAHFILENFEEGMHFIHFNGSYHSDNYDGIIWYVNEYRPGLNIKTITTVSQDDIYSLEEKNAAKADFIIVVPSDMTKTY